MAHPDAPKPRLTTDEAARFSGEMANIAQAGLPLAPGLRATAEELPAGRLRSALISVADALDTGAPLEAVVSDPGSRLPLHLQGLVLIGQKTGRLGPVLSRFVSFKDVGVALRRQLWNSLTYPVLALAITLAIIAFVSATVIPAFEQIFQDFGIPLPIMTTLVIQLGRALAVSWVALGELVIALAILALCIQLFTGRDQRRSLLRGVPLLGAVWRNTSLAEFCHLLAILIESEVPLPEATRLTGDGVGDAAIARACRTMADDIEKGLALSDAIARNALFPRGLPRLLKWAEGHQSLAGSLHMAGDMYEATARGQASFAGTVLTVLTVVTILVGISATVVALFLPLVTLISKLSG